jgi:hypothetical protein
MQNQTSTDSAPDSASPHGPSVHPGSCHCGAVRFEAAIDLGQSPSKCNCSICLKASDYVVGQRERARRRRPEHAERGALGRPAQQLARRPSP